MHTPVAFSWLLRGRRLSWLPPQCIPDRYSYLYFWFVSLGCGIWSSTPGLVFPGWSLGLWTSLVSFSRLEPWILVNFSRLEPWLNDLFDLFPQGETLDHRPPWLGLPGWSFRLSTFLVRFPGSNLGSSTSSTSWLVFPGWSLGRSTLLVFPGRSLGLSTFLGWVCFGFISPSFYQKLNALFGVVWLGLPWYGCPLKKQKRNKHIIRGLENKMKNIYSK